MIEKAAPIEEKYLAFSRELLKVIFPQNVRAPFVITVAGESGSGKTTTAFHLQHVLEKEHGVRSVILHQDDYFHLPPKQNHQKREKDISWVGTQEVRLDLIQQNIDQYLAMNQSTTITKPLMHRDTDTCLTEELTLSHSEVLIVEGTYVTELTNIGCKVFFDQSYKDTYEKRKERARDVFSPFVEQVLDIEQKIISSMKPLASVVVSKEGQIIKQG